MSTFAEEYLTCAVETISKIDFKAIERMAEMIAHLRSSAGRLFVLGVGGSAANASHAVNDFRKLCDIEAFCPTDNVAEFSARANDYGWGNSFKSWLVGADMNVEDAILVLSVGGGSVELSANIVEAVKWAQFRRTAILGIVGRDGGFTAKCAHACVIVPPIDSKLITPLTESMQSVILHLLCSHPLLQKTKATWEAHDENLR